MKKQRGDPPLVQVNPSGSRTECKPRAINSHFLGVKRGFPKGRLTGETPCEVGEVYKEQVNRANILLKARMENNAEIIRYANRHKLVD